MYDRYRLGVGDELAGPAVVEEEGSTLVVGPGATARVAPSGNIVMTLAPHPTLSPEGRGGAGYPRPRRGRGQGEGAMMPTRFDAITLEVLWTRIISVVDEAAKAIVRTSFSTLSNEANDFACVLTDARGFALAQNSRQHPVLHRHAARDRRAISCAGSAPENMRPGDVLITNDPGRAPAT